MSYVTDAAKKICFSREELLPEIIYFANNLKQLFPFIFGRRDGYSFVFPIDKAYIPNKFMKGVYAVCNLL